MSILCQKGLRASRKPPFRSGLEGLEAFFLGRRRPGRRPEQVLAGVEGEAPIAGPGVIIKQERHPPRSGDDRSLALRVVGEYHLALDLNS